MGVWIDTDMGVDDLFAIMAVAQHREIAALSLSFGNAPLPRVVRNAAGAVVQYGWTCPVYAGAERAILGAVETAERILGARGMPSRGAQLPDLSGNFPPALPALTAWLEQQRDAKILALGPLTNIATLVLSRPDLVAHIGRLTWMGGGITRGNHTASAEFNALADPEALAILLARKVPLDMVDLDACRRVEIVEADVASIPQPARDLLGGYLDIALTRGRAAMALYDPVAAALLVRPDLFTLADAHLEVELAGHLTRGRTVVDQRDPTTANCRIVADMDAPSVKAVCLAALKGDAP